MDGKEVDVSADDLELLQELGRGAYGVVEKMRHRPSSTIMAVKVGTEKLAILCERVWPFLCLLEMRKKSASVIDSIRLKDRKYVLFLYTEMYCKT